MISMILKGLLIGVIVSAPVGPIGILCIQRTLNGGKGHGISTALGATASDLLYAIIAAFSMSMVVDFIDSHRFILKIIGTIFVFFFGVYTYATNPVSKLKKMRGGNQNYIQDFVSSFLLTVTNPLVIFLFIALFTKYSYLTGETSFAETILGILFILMGACFWWTAVVGTVSHFRDRFNMRGLYVVNKGTGILLMCIAVISIIYFIIDQYCPFVLDHFSIPSST
ncbi:MAG: LysE family transporter [Paludibacteraceae bacterium]|nr:LysE family transporter [Paludibacteraceae bacterium]